MGFPDTPSEAPQLYPQAIQLKLYQAFIFSIPILFSIILFLLFYLFYLKRRASVLSSPPILPTSSNQATTYVHSTCEHIGWKGEIKDRLPTILFDEELRTRDSQCCVCLGEFEIKEELLQVPSCKHVFHVECIHYWLHSNTTCPLCRCSIVPITKLYNPATASVVTRLLQDSGTNSNQNQQNTPSEQQEQQQLDGICTEQLTIHIEGSSSTSSACSISSKRLSEMSSTGNDGSSDQESVVAHMHIPNA